MNKPPRITLYASSGCPHCRQVGNWLRQHKIGFQQVDIGKNRRAAVEFQRLGGRSVPLLSIGQQTVIGADMQEIRRALVTAGLLPR